MDPTEDRPLTASWEGLDGSTTEDVVARLDRDGITAEGRVTRGGELDVHWVLRLDLGWRVRQLLVFRDLEDPDLWLGHDGHGRWGEVNGAHRSELDGCTVVDLACTPFTNTIPIRHLSALPVGTAGEVKVAWIDPATLAVVPGVHRYTHLAERRWRFEDPEESFSQELVLDNDGLVLDYPTLFRRTA